MDRGARAGGEVAGFIWSILMHDLALLPFPPISELVSRNMFGRNTSLISHLNIFKETLDEKTYLRPLLNKMVKSCSCMCL